MAGWGDLPGLSAVVSGHGRAMAWGTCRGLRGGWTTWWGLGWMRCGFRRFTRRRWRISAMTWRITPAWTRCLGRMADFDALLAGCHARGLKLILDFVPNHTSDQHPWFVASRSSRRDAKRDWYLWRDRAVPDGACVPNNWMSNFGGTAWTLDEATGQYYCHSFLPEQPDLNWRNPAVRAAMYGAMRFWLEKGVGRISDGCALAADQGRPVPG